MAGILEELIKLAEETVSKIKTIQEDGGNMKAHCKIIHLCDSCIYEYPSCEADTVRFGQGKGEDNIIECNIFNQGDKLYIACPSNCHSDCELYFEA